MFLCVPLFAPQVRTETADLDAGLIFEQDPVQIVDALLPLYMNASLLRSLQVSKACRLPRQVHAGGVQLVEAKRHARVTCSPTQQLIAVCLQNRPSPKPPTARHLHPVPRRPVSSVAAGGAGL